MPNQEAIERAAARRQARDNSKDSAKSMVAEETREIAEITQKQAEDRASGKTVAQPKTISKVAAKSRAEKREAAARAANAQAERDVRVVPERDIEAELAAYRERGEVPPLHLLNAEAKMNDAGVRDEAREIANAVGKMAYTQALGRSERNRHTRIKKMNEAIAVQREAAKTE